MLDINKAYNFCDKNVFLTGGSRGIGKAIKDGFLALGAKVDAPSRTEMDLLSEQSVNNYINSKSLNYDIFIHCAGLNKLAGISEVDTATMVNCFQVNLFSAVSLLHSIVPYMKKQNSGRIIFISSLYAIISREKRIAYSCSKNALTGLMKTLALELAPYNILVNAIAPGYVMTEMTKKNLTLDEQEEIIQRIPLKRFQNETDISNLVLFLCSSLNQNLTGQLIAVDGGYLCQ